MQDNTFKSHNFRFWKWVAWAVITVPLCAYVLKSTFDLWPNLVWMAIFSAVSVVGASLYAAVYTTENSPTLRNTALAALGVIEFALFANAAAHGGGARAFENASAAREERQIDENRQIAIERQRAETATKLSEARAREAESLAVLSKHDAAKIDSANRYAKRTGVKVGVTTAAPAAPLPASVAAEEPAKPTMAEIETDADLKKRRAMAKQESPAETREWWFWPIFLGLLAELGTAIGGAYRITRVRLRDSNRNSIADWKEELSAEELKQRFPADYEALYGEPAKKETRH